MPEGLGVCAEASVACEGVSIMCTAGSAACEADP